jgi:phage gp16-like protein
MAKPVQIRNDLAQIHIAKKDLGMDDETYRAMLFTVARVYSAKDLDFHGRKRVIEHMKARGWKNRPAKKAKTTRPLASDDQSMKIRALWLELYAAGAITDSSEAALAKYVQRITKVAALQWLSVDQASRVIETLKKWLGRIGEQA